VRKINPPRPQTPRSNHHYDSKINILIKVRFHVTRLGFAAVDEVRRRIQPEHTGHRGRAGDPLFGIRRVLRRGFDHHSPRSWAKPLAGLDAGDTDDEQLARTWIAAQETSTALLLP
jgi:transposase